MGDEGELDVYDLEVYDLKGWKLTNHGNLPVPTVAQFKEMVADRTAHAVYQAQWDVFFPGNEHGGVEPKPGFASAKEMARFARTIQKSAYAKEQWPKFAAGKPVKFYIGTEGSPLEQFFGVPAKAREDPAYLPYGSVAATNSEMLTVAVANDGLGRHKSTVLHELAHVINDYEGVMRDHGPNFLNIYVKLIQQYMPEKQAAFVAAAKDAGLTW